MGTKFAPEVYDTDYLRLSDHGLPNSQHHMAVGFTPPLGLAQIAFLGAMGAAKEIPSGNQTWQWMKHYG